MSCELEQSLEKIPTGEYKDLIYANLKIILMKNHTLCVDEKMHRQNARKEKHEVNIDKLTELKWESFHLRLARPYPRPYHWSLSHTLGLFIVFNNIYIAALLTLF